MTRAPTYFVRMTEGVRGPFTVEQLRDFAEAGVVSRETEAANVREGPWVPVDALPERELIFPPRVRFGLKPTPFESLNSADGGAPLDVRDFVAATKTDGPVLRPDRPQALNPPDPPQPLNEVQAMVNEVNALEAQLAPARAAAPARRKLSARLKLVLALAVAGNAVLAAIVFAYDGFKDPWAMLVFKAWFVTYNGGMVILYFTQPKP